MGKFILACVLVSLISVSLGDPERPGRYLQHNKKVTNCAKYAREHNQYQCVLSPFNTEGPFYLPDDHERADITDGQQGVALNLTINIVNAVDCTPMAHHYVHIWHTNGLGKYSGVRNGGPPPSDGQPRGPPPNGPHGPRGPNGHPEDRKPPQKNGGGGRPTPISDERFLRGYQVTGDNGQVSFSTILPGWYNGRCLHIHIEVYPKDSTAREDILYVGQIFFDATLPDQLKLIEPYSQNDNRITYNNQDGIYNHHGNETILNMIKQKEQQFTAEITFGVDPDAKVTPF